MNDILGKLHKPEPIKARIAETQDRHASTARGDITVTPRLHIIATVINIDRNETFYQIAYEDIEGVSQTKMLPRELFNRPFRVVESLSRWGAALPDNPKAAVKIVNEAILSKSATIRRVTERAGWYEGRSFVYPGETFGEHAGKVLYQRSDNLTPALGLTAGTLKAWQEGLLEPSKYSDYLIIAIGHKAANAFLEPMGEQEGCILHLHGSKSDSSEKAASSSGKTLATRVAASLTGRCMKSDMVSFAISELGLGDLAAAQNHLGVEIDEIGRADTNAKGPRMGANQFSYQFASGRGSFRSKRASRDPDLQNRVWLGNAISNGEPTLDGVGREQQRAEGEKVRMIGLPVPSGAEGGIFNRLKDKSARKRAEHCKALAELTENAISANYGVLFPQLIRAIIPSRVAMSERLRRRVARLVQEAGADSNPWERRFARKLALAAATAMELSSLHLVPWSEKRAKRAFLRMYRQARGAVATIDELADGTVARLRTLLLDSSPPKLEKGTKPSDREWERAQDGFLRKIPGIGLAFVIPMARFEKLVSRRGTAGAVIQKLAQQRIAHPGEDGSPTRQVAIEGRGRRRYACFDAGALRR
ncbi:MAG TPA: DUF927 domain-containing protein [Xanthobacteraceae bacterium]|jgi:hypothetical protein|nr:DUF927 domain-containing protein [Xanthobacteraceae bacterium]